MRARVEQPRWSDMRVIEERSARPASEALGLATLSLPATCRLRAIFSGTARNAAGRVDPLVPGSAYGTSLKRTPQHPVGLPLANS